MAAREIDNLGAGRYGESIASRADDFIWLQPVNASGAANQSGKLVGIGVCHCGTRFTAKPASFMICIARSADGREIGATFSTWRGMD